MVFPGLCPIFQEEKETLAKRKYKDCWKARLFFISYAEKSEEKNMLIPASHIKSCSYPFI